MQRTLEELRGQHRLKETKTRAGRRRIDLSRFALNALNDHMQPMLAEGLDVKSGLMFCDRMGGFLRKTNGARRAFGGTILRINKTATKEAEKTNRKPDLLPLIRFHDLRHTAATLLLMAGENPKVVSERLGHEDIVITHQTYSHVLPSIQKGAAEKMDKIFYAKPHASGESTFEGA